MAEPKTRATNESVSAFIDSVASEARRRECRALARIMKSATKARPKMWGPSMVGFGSYHYTYATGREGDWFLTGFSPRKEALSVYIMSGFERHKAHMAKLGKYKTGKSCLYIKKLEDVDLKVLARLIQDSVAHVAKAHR